MPYFPYITFLTSNSQHVIEMNKRTVRITPSIGLWLLLLWGFPYWSVRTGYAVREAQLERKAQEAMVGLSDDQLFHFTVQRQDSNRIFRWEHAGEFEYQGQMFDVSRREVRGDTLHLWCYWDAAETDLKRSEATAGHDAPTESSLPLAWLMQWVQVWLVPNGTLSVPLPQKSGSDDQVFVHSPLAPGHEASCWRPPTRPA